MIRHSSPYKTGGSPPSHLFRSGPQAAVPIRDPSVDGTGGAFALPCEALSARVAGVVRGPCEVERIGSGPVAQAG